MSRILLIVAVIVYCATRKIRLRRADSISGSYDVSELGFQIASSKQIIFRWSSLLTCVLAIPEPSTHRRRRREYLQRLISLFDSEKLPKLSED